MVDSPTAEEQAEFEELLEVLRRTRGFDFTGYKRASLMRRVRRRMADVKVGSFAEYVDRLELHPAEFTALFNTMLINVTSFFRDLPAWDQLREEVIPAVIDGSGGTGNIRVWSAGCASGEEAYALAILLVDALGEAEFRRRVKIYATDVDEEALATARAAVYSQRQLASVPAVLRDTYFEPVGSHWTFRRDLRRSVICGRNDLTVDAPISRVDLLVCRNTLMYFTAETQSRVLRRFHFALAEAGVLFLGKAEMVLSHSDLFQPIDLTNRLFTKNGHGRRRRPLDLAAARASTTRGAVESVEAAAFGAAPIAQILVDAEGLLVLANSRAEAMLGIHLRDVGRPFQDLEVSYRPIELRSLIDQVLSSRRPTQVGDVEWRRTPGAEPTYLHVTVTPLSTPDAWPAGVVISFIDTSDYRRMRTELGQAHTDLKRAYEGLQSANEELETTNEELQSTIEELETTNEELQSTNEELETMNQELVTTNDDLHSVNSELHARRQQLDQTSSFLQNVMAGLGKAVIVLDRQFRVHAWSPSAEELWGLRAEEVEKADFFGLDMGLPVKELEPLLRRIVETEEPASAQFDVDAINRRGHSMRLVVQLSQLRDGESVDGAIVLMHEPVPAGVPRP